MAAERLQKVLSRAGIASRRKAEELIVAGRVRVRGRVVTELGTRVDPERDRVEVDGRRVVEEARAYVVLHKPRAVMCTMRDPEGRRTVAELVQGVGVRVVPVGRLDYHTSGVLLLTNDGDFAAALSHPRTGASKVYVAKVDGRASSPAGVELLRVEGDKTWIELTLHEGKNRQVRRLGERAGHPVLRLVRSSFAGITAEGLKPGQWRYLTIDELTELKQRFGVPRKIRSAMVEPGVFGRAKMRPRPASSRDGNARPLRSAPQRPPPRTEDRPPRADARRAPPFKPGPRGTSSARARRSGK
jgi:23S rRNA pseudouridine2605 synthase